MNHDDDLERLISGSLTSRSERIGSAAHSLDDVHRRVELRRGRRRHVAAFGATTMLAVGAFALTAIGSSDPTTVPLPAADGDGSTPGLQAVWRCTGPLDVSDGSDAAFFADCERAGIDGNGAVISVPVTTDPLYPTTTTVCLAPPSTAPATDPAVTTVPCNWGPPPTMVPLPTSTTVSDARSPYEQEHTIRPGDSLSSIADLYGITLEQLVNYNMFADGADHLLVPDERLLVPPGALVPTAEPTTTATTTTTTTTTTTSMP